MLKMVLNIRLSETSVLLITLNILILGSDTLHQIYVD